MPDTFKLRELLAMTEARERAAWGRMASLMALVANAHRDPKKYFTARPEQFNPYAGRERSSELTRRRRPRAPLSILRDVFCSRNTRENGK